MKSKLTSRKFWMALAAFLASFGMGLTGIMPPEVCGICMALSAAIYAACEAYVDGQLAKAATTSVQISASTYDSNTVEKLASPEGQN